jgi:hypothetical protein
MTRKNKKETKMQKERKKERERTWEEVDVG